jgi:tetratricopeptide (TPR) repeat protein
MESQVIGSAPDHVPADPLSWPVRSGSAPALDDNFYPRPETGLSLASGALPGETVVLTNAEPAAAGGQYGAGGLGKTQIAAWHAHELVRSRAVDLLVWIAASSRDAVVTGYAQALADLGESDATETPASVVPRLLDWLATASRPWLVVLDGLADPSHMSGLWPPGAVGRVLVTAGTPAPLAGQSGRVVPVGPFSRREAVNYLTGALKHDPGHRRSAPDLAWDLECLPMALSFAAAVIADQHLDAEEYRALFADRERRLASVRGGPCPLPVLVAWSLAVDRAETVIPGGVAWPVLAFASLLDPAGVPAAVLMSRAACSFLTGRPGAAPAQGQAQVRHALTALARLGLLAVDMTSSSRTIRMHALVQHAARNFLAADYSDKVGRAAADALAEVWPGADAAPALAQAMRDCAARLREYTGGLLWADGCHPVLLKAGQSLETAGLTGSAVGYWQQMADASGRKLRVGHPDMLLIRGRLASSHEQAGQLAEAIELHRQVLTDLERTLGTGHAETAAARGNLARAYLTAGRAQEAISLSKRILADRERMHGPRDLDTQAARAALAACHQAAGQLKDAIPLYERILADRDQVQGPRHPDTIAARASLAFAYRTAGLMKRAIPLYERTLADREQVQGPHHPDTLTARGNLAAAYHSMRRLKDAVPVYERTLADREQVQGPHHPDTLTARGNLASAYHSARHLADAIRLYEHTIADSEHVLGHGHPDTLTLRSNLAHAYHTAGRLTDAIALFQQTLEESERALGPDHLLTVTARENLAAVTRA